MFGWERIVSSENISAGRNVKLYKKGDKVIIDADIQNSTTIKHGEHIISGEFIEIEAGEGVVINTAHPNKLKISVDLYKFFGCIDKIDKLEFLNSIEKRLTALEQKEK